MLVYRSVKCRLTKKTLSPKTGVSLNGGTPNLPPQVMIIFSRSFPMGLLGKPTILGNPYYFPLYWLVNRDPYNGLWNNPYISLYTWAGCHPLYNPTNQGPFFHCSCERLGKVTRCHLRHPFAKSPGPELRKAKPFDQEFVKTAKLKDFKINSIFVPSKKIT